MNARKARQIIGDATVEELQNIVSELQSKEFLFIESDIERLQAAKALLKAKAMA
jgi:hypothetical protein